MKKLFKLSAIIAAAAMMLISTSIVSCASDDDDNNGTDTSRETQLTITKTLKAASKAYISIKDGDIYTSSNNNVEIVYNGNQFVSAEEGDVNNGKYATITDNQEGIYNFTTSDGYAGTIVITSGTIGETDIHVAIVAKKINNNSVINTDTTSTDSSMVLDPYYDTNASGFHTMIAKLDSADAKYVIVDGRTAALYAAGHIKGAVNYNVTVQNAASDDAAFPAWLKTNYPIASGYYVLIYGCPFYYGPGRVSNRGYGKAHTYYLNGNYAAWVTAYPTEIE